MSFLCRINLRQLLVRRPINDPCCFGYFMSLSSSSLRLLLMIIPVVCVSCMWLPPLPSLGSWIDCSHRGISCLVKREVIFKWWSCIYTGDLLGGCEEMTEGCLEGWWESDLPSLVGDLCDEINVDDPVVYLADIFSAVLWYLRWIRFVPACLPGSLDVLKSAEGSDFDFSAS